MTLVYQADPVRGEQWAHLFAERAPHIEFRLWPDIGDPGRVRWLVAQRPPAHIGTVFPNLEILFSTAAGVDHIDLADVPPGVSLVRMVEPGLAAGMAEYVMHAVLSLHREFAEYKATQALGLWRPRPARDASQIRVGVLGLGVLARTSLQRLVQFGYDCAAWSRSAHDMFGVECSVGAQGLHALLARTDVLVCLLPLTDETRGILNHELLSRLPRGASLVQVARGAHLDQRALMRLLDSGHLHRAWLDVTDPEPLPADHALWRHPRVRITPHVASSSRPQTAVDAVIENIRRHMSGQALDGLVDRDRGY